VRFKMPSSTKHDGTVRELRDITSEGVDTKLSCSSTSAKIPYLGYYVCFKTYRPGVYDGNVRAFLDITSAKDVETKPSHSFTKIGGVRNECVFRIHRPRSYDGTVKVLLDNTSVKEGETKPSHSFTKIAMSVGIRVSKESVLSIMKD
jgi:hypothetical protein